MSGQVPPLRGRIEVASLTRIAGWAFDPAAPGAAVLLELVIDGRVEGRLVADGFRADLAKAGIGEGRHAFAVTIPQGLPLAQDREIRVRHAGDGREVPGSPVRLTAEAGLPWRAGLDDAIRRAARASPAEVTALVTVLAEQAAALWMAQGGAMPEPVRSRLARFATTALPGTAGEAGAVRPQALFVDEGVPSARRDAGSNAAISHMRSLMRLGYQVHFVAGSSMARAGERSAGLEAMGVTCWHSPWAGSVEEVLRVLGDRLGVVYVHRFGVMQRYGALVRRWAPGARLLYCVADLHFLRAARRFAVEAGLALDAPEGEVAAEGVRTGELLAAVAADVVITHSSYEAALLRRVVPEAHAALIPWDVPVGPEPAPEAGRRGVAFVGSYGHAPNLDAAHALLEEVMPLVWAVDPSIPLILAGSDLPAGLRAAAAGVTAGPVEVLGWVEDLGALLGRVRLTAAPLRYGAGLKGKVLDSLAAGVPCVGSPMAGEGMELPEALGGLIGADAAAMAAVILDLHRDAARYERVRDAGRSWIGARFGTARIDEALRAAIGLGQ
jgi:glycosyltransferase involved in cell wall biosynthesis